MFLRNNFLLRFLTNQSQNMISRSLYLNLRLVELLVSFYKIGIYVISNFGRFVIWFFWTILYFRLDFWMINLWKIPQKMVTVQMKKTALQIIPLLQNPQLCLMVYMVCIHIRSKSPKYAKYIWFLISTEVVWFLFRL